MDSATPLILTIHSLCSWGDVGLKAMACCLHNHWVPIPSAILNAPRNHPMSVSAGCDLSGLFSSVMQLPETRNRRLILHIGFLPDVTALKTLCAQVETYRARFESIVVDPVCGDLGRAYQPQPLIQLYPELLEIADIHLPNATELLLISGMSSIEVAFEGWIARFPNARVIVTGVENGDQIGLQVRDKETRSSIWHERAPGHRSGTGDRFSAAFLREHFIDGKSFQCAARLAAHATAQWITQPSS